MTDDTIFRPTSVKLEMTLEMPDGARLIYTYYNLIPSDSDAIVVNVRDETDVLYEGEDRDGSMLRVRPTGRKFLTVNVNDVLMLPREHGAPLYTIIKMEAEHDSGSTDTGGAEQS